VIYQLWSVYDYGYGIRVWVSPMRPPVGLLVLVLHYLCGWWHGRRADMGKLIYLYACLQMNGVPEPTLKNVCLILYTRF